MTPLRLTLTYWSAHYVLGRVGPAIALTRKPQPDCPDCGGDGAITYDQDFIDTEPCPCASHQELALPLPRIINPNYRQHRSRQKLTAHSRSRGNLQA